ncbi:unnamed protein product [Peronospora destructor]|uniref:Phytanoyl-CoA dioxygenase n=1 Tax=Peronospora destructor TaxID=86335 RepID=A0AAV0U8Y7_9STRA|nr:unnamed protein product [Peronospora destructor]
MPLETGTVVQATHVSSGYSFRALVEHCSSSGSLILSLCSTEKPYEKLKVALNGQVTWALAATKLAAFLVEFEATEETTDGIYFVHLKAIPHQKKVNRLQLTGWYLGVSGSGLIGDEGKGDGSLFRLEVVSPRASFLLDTARSVMSQSRCLSILSKSQRLSFMQNGYLQIRGAVALPLANAALRRINRDLGIPGNMIDGGVEGNIKLAGNTSNSDAGAQIALRFPELGEAREPLGTEWHTDGMRQGRLHPFTLLAGIALSNVPEPLCGNLTVFPGSHVSLQSRLAADGKLHGCDNECYKSDSVWGDGTLPELGTPVQLLAARGDLVLAHPNLAHRGGLNFSPDIRYQVYFRIKHKLLDDLQEQCMSDLWADLGGLSLDNKSSINQGA